MFPGATLPFKACPPTAVPPPLPLAPSQSSGDDLEAALIAYRSQMGTETEAAPILTPLAPVELPVELPPEEITESEAEEWSPASSLTDVKEKASPEYDAFAGVPREEEVVDDPWVALQRAREDAHADIGAETSVHASAPWRRRSRSPVRAPVQSARVPTQPACAPPPHIFAKAALSPPPPRVTPLPPPPPPPVRPKPKPAPSWEGAYWRAGAQRYGSRGGLKNPNVQWHSMKSKAEREGWLDSFLQNFKKPQ